MMSDADMLIGMQMFINHKLYFGYFLFEGWSVESTGSFIGVMIFIALFSFLSEFAGYMIAARKDSTLAMLLYPMLICINYLQMLMVMTFNIWVVLFLVVFQSVAHFGFKKLQTKA